MANIIEASKITLTTFRPKRIGGEDISVHKVILGYLVGQASGIVTSETPDKSEVFKGLKGTFEARIANVKTGEIEEVIVSGKAFVSSPFGDKFIDALSDKVDEKTGEVVEEGARRVEFAYTIGVQRAGNPNGYEWVLEPLIEMAAENDPLKSLKSLLPPSVSGLPQLAAPKAEGKK